MPNSTVNARILDVAESLNTNAEKLNDSVKVVKQDEVKRKVQFIILAISVVLDLALSGGFFYGLHVNSDSQNKISNTLYTNCQSVNDEHRRQLQLWDGLINLPKTPGTPETPKSTLDAFNKLLSETFTIKDCSNLKH